MTSRSSVIPTIMFPRQMNMTGTTKVSVFYRVSVKRNFLPKKSVVWGFSLRVFGMERTLGGLLLYQYTGQGVGCGHTAGPGRQGGQPPSSPRAAAQAASEQSSVLRKQLPSRLLQHWLQMLWRVEHHSLVAWAAAHDSRDRSNEGRLPPCPAAHQPPAPQWARQPSKLGGTPLALLWHTVWETLL